MSRPAPTFEELHTPGGEEGSMMESTDFSDMSDTELEHAAPYHNREWCTCPYCEELRKRDAEDESTA